MATIAEISSYGPGQPIVDLRAVVKSCYPPKPFGQQGGTFQNAMIEDASGEVAAQFIDVEVYQGQPFMATSQQTVKKELGQERVAWDGAAYTEMYKDKFRFTIKKKGFAALAGGPAAPALPPQPAYSATGGFIQTPQQLAPGTLYAAQAAPPYAQAATQPVAPGSSYNPHAVSPPPPPYGAPGDPPMALPPVGSAQRPGLAWMATQPLTIQPHESFGGGRSIQPAMSPATAKAPWQPPAKMGEAEARGLLEKNYLMFCSNLCRDFGVPDGPEHLPAEVVAGAMAWSTSLLIAIQRGDVIREPEGAAEPEEPWPAAGQAMSPAGDGGPAFDAGPEDGDIAFGG